MYYDLSTEFIVSNILYRVNTQYAEGSDCGILVSIYRCKDLAGRPLMWELVCFKSYDHRKHVIYEAHQKTINRIEGRDECKASIAEPYCNYCGDENDQ